MQGKYRVITLCGSTRFKDEFLKAQKELTLEGNIVISVGLFGHAGDQEVWTEGTKEMLDDMHQRKIDMADEIFVINVGGYIGSSTASEIAYARKNGKPVKYLEPMAALETCTPAPQKAGRLRPGVYRHFKGNLYRVLFTALHTETEEECVVYQALYPPYDLFVRPAAMFLSEVDHEKYPDTAQQYRFEYVGSQKEEKRQEQ